MSSAKERINVHAVNTSSERVNKAAKNEREFECPRCGHCCREWVGLSRDEALDIEEATTHPLEFARAIEAKLKEKNT